MRITRLKISNYRGIVSLDAPISEAGAIVQGSNAIGKTSVLSAIRSALESRDISPDAIHTGASKAEVLVNLDHETVRRVLTPKSSSVTITTADGAERKKPQSFLDDLIGPTLDPLDLFLADKKERRSRVLAAMPVRVTREQLRRWAPDLPDGPDLSQEHGLEALSRVRQSYYDKRHIANSEAKAAQVEVERLVAAIPKSPHPAGVPSVAEAERSVQEARANLVRLETLAKQSREYLEKTTALQNTISTYRKQALEQRPDPTALAVTADHRDKLLSQEQELETQLRRVRAEREEADTLMRQKQALAVEATRLEKEAAAMESLLATLTPVEVNSEELNGALGAVAGSEDELVKAQDVARAEAARTAAVKAEVTANKLREEAERLDTIVKALTDEAPKALLASSGAIPGLGMDGDKLTLDGVSIDSLSGMEQLRFAVQVAKRANATRKLKLLLVDGMERLDPDQLNTFVKEATSDGFQLIGTRVSHGELVLEAIELESTA